MPKCCIYFCRTLRTYLTFPMMRWVTSEDRLLWRTTARTFRSSLGGQTMLWSEDRTACTPKITQVSYPVIWLSSMLYLPPLPLGCAAQSTSIVCYTLCIQGKDRNFALEYYGENSRCFDHTEDMWEERSCSQVRQWQHWGSGCYNYICASGRLHIVVLNHTFTCYYPRQVIDISLLDNGWLHTGSLVCPACEEVCSGQNFSSRVPRVGYNFVNDYEVFKCRPGILPPKNFVYHQDVLACGADRSYFSISLVAILSLLMLREAFLLWEMAVFR